jgi:UDP-N-acetylmuramate dehydrogenase
MSYYKKSPEWIILEATLQLQNVEGRASLELGEETIRERERRHLQNVRAAGSFFMNPVAPDSVQKLFEDEKHTTAREGRVPAGWLIEKAGMKGAKVGDAQASLQHPNYLVNTGNASSGDVLVLALKIKKEVKDHFGIDLKEEAEILR